MKNWLIRLQILLVLLIFLSPIFYLSLKQYKPLIDLAKYDKQRAVDEATYPKLSWLSTSGRSIVQANGQPIILRGVNIASTTWGPEYEAWNPTAVVSATRDWHANVIRSRIHQYEYEQNQATFFLKLEQQILGPARARGAYVILHPWFGENTSLPDAVGEEMWVAVAKRYKDDPHILYDLFAEPRDISHDDIKKAYNNLIPRMRAINPRALIFVTGSDWGREINSWVEDPLPYPNIVYRTNPYNRTGEFEGYFGKIAETQPVFIGEFGTESKLTMKEVDVKNLLGYADSLGIGWTAWHFSDSGCPCLLSNNSAFTPSSYGELVKHSLAGQKFTYTLPRYDRDANKYYIYSDFFENGFSDYSWLTNSTLQSSGSVQSGNFAFLAKLANAGGIYFHSSRMINPNEYSTFNLAINSTIAQNLTLRFRDESDKLSDPIKMSDYVHSNGSWDTVTIPTTIISIDQISGIMWESNHTLTKPETVLLDQIYFAK